MPYEDPDPEDPNVLVGVGLPADREAVREMAWTFAEEFAVLGYDEAWLVRMFQNPAFAGPRQAWVTLGEDEVREIVRDSVASFGRVRFVTRDRGGPAAPPAGLFAARPAGFRPLPVITDLPPGGC